MSAQTIPATVVKILAVTWMAVAAWTLILWAVRTRLGWTELRHRPERVNYMQIYAVLLVLFGAIVVQYVLAFAFIQAGLLNRESLAEPALPAAAPVEVEPIASTAAETQPGTQPHVQPLTAEQAGQRFWGNALQIGFLLAGSVLALLMGRSAFREGLQGFGLKAGRVGHDILAGLKVMAVIFPLCIALLLLTNIIAEEVFKYTPDVHPLFYTLDPTHPHLVISSILLAALAAPIGEELFFRGIVQSFLARFFLVMTPPRGFPTMAFWLHPPELQEAQARAAEARARALESPPGGEEPTPPTPHEPEPLSRSQVARRVIFAIVVSALFFTSVHIPLWTNLPALFLLALALGYAYEKTGSLVTVMAMHVTFNSLNLGVSLLLRGAGGG